MVYQQLCDITTHLKVANLQFLYYKAMVMLKIYIQFLFVCMLSFVSLTTVSAAPNTSRVTLFITDSSNSVRKSRIVFSEGLGYTIGLDEGYDAGAFGGDTPGTGFHDRFGNMMSLYTLFVDAQLRTDLALTIQSLPYEEIGNMIIDIGVNPSTDGLITFTAVISDAAGDPASFPLNHRLLLEDRTLNVFTELQNSGDQYEVSLTQDEPELGRFYLHTTTDTTAPLGPGTLLAPIMPSNDILQKLVGSCGVGAEEGSVLITTIPANGFTNQYNTAILLDDQGGFTIANPNWKEGNYTLNYSCTDKVGNGPTFMAPVEPVSIDVTAPPDPTIDPVIPKDTTITGTAEEGTQITLNIDTCLNAPVITLAGIWSCDIHSDITLNDGGQIVVTSTDSAGNFSKVTHQIPTTKKRKSTKNYVCKDQSAINYNRFGVHKPSICEYEIESFQTNAIPSLAASKTKILDTDHKSCGFEYSRLMKKGMIGQDVQQVQTCISSLDFQIGPIDGIFGILTYSGIISYQTANGLTIDGIIGSETATHLSAINAISRVDANEILL